MIFVGLLVLVGVVGLSLAVIWVNDGVFAAPAGAIELLGSQLNPTVGQTFLGGAGAGALVLLGMLMVFSGLSRNAHRRSVGRHKLNDQRQHGTVSSDLAAHRAADVKAADGVTAWQ